MYLFTANFTMSIKSSWPKKKPGWHQNFLWNFGTTWNFSIDLVPFPVELQWADSHTLP